MNLELGKREVPKAMICSTNSGDSRTLLNYESTNGNKMISKSIFQKQ
jgi:hypothetical protein